MAEEGRRERKEYTNVVLYVVSKQVSEIQDNKRSKGSRSACFIRGYE